VWEISYFFGGDSGVQSKPEKIWKLASKEKRGSYIAIKESGLFTKKEEWNLNEGG
jgi:hypothetical protein